MIFKPLTLPSNLKVDTKRKVNIAKTSKEQLLKDLKAICNHHGVTLMWDKTFRAGAYDYRNKIIIINPNFRKSVLPFMVFHEMGHHYCYKNKVWKAYHYDKKQTTNFKRTALRAEKWCDSYGEFQAELYFSHNECYKPYHQPKFKSYKQIHGLS